MEDLETIVKLEAMMMLLASCTINFDDKRHGLVQYWYSNGQLTYEKNYVDGKRHGLAQRWHENGQLFSEVNYVDGNPIE
tara:strand:+ start:17 stop:253 length:237 start_codon:yes stop_codon:yes gene_type:complete